VPNHAFPKFAILPESAFPSLIGTGKRLLFKELLPVWSEGELVAEITLHDFNKLYGRGWFRCAAVVSTRLLHHAELTIQPGTFYDIVRAICRIEIDPVRLADRHNGWCILCRKYLAAERFPDLSGVCDHCRKSQRKTIAAIDGNLRRVREISASGQHTQAEWVALLKKYRRRCLRCGSRDDITRDHVQPLVCGGSNAINNIQPLCRRCNSWKGRRTIDFRDDDHLRQKHPEVSALTTIPGGHSLRGGQ